MSRIRLKIRGIYSTALTGLFLEHGGEIVDPSPVIQSRFGISPSREREEVTLWDRGDKQGVVLEGNKDAVERLFLVLKESFPEAIFHLSSREETLKSLAELRKLSWGELQQLGRGKGEVEFPFNVKLALDALRSRFAPTLPYHHLLKAIDSARVDQAEKELSLSPQSAAELSRCLRQELIYAHYTPGRNLAVEHSKIEGSILGLRGKIKEFSPEGSLVLLRRFRGGSTYDGLGVPKEEGDWGTVELDEGSWICRRCYFSASGELKGEIYNINTPVEFYPDRVRYVDLEVDVVKLPGSPARLIDQDKLEQQVKQGLVTRELAQQALSRAEELLRKLNHPQQSVFCS
jgi:Ribonuclease G/E